MVTKPKKEDESLPGTIRQVKEDITMVREELKDVKEEVTEPLRTRTKLRDKVRNRVRRRLFGQWA